MALDPKDQMLMRDAFYDALDKWSGKNKGGFGGSAGSSGGSGNLPPPGTSVLGRAATEAGGAIKGLAGGALDLGVKMAKGGLSVTDATKTMGGALKDAGFAGAKLTSALGSTINKFGDLINYVEEGLDTFRDLSKTGATFNNSVVDMRAAAAGSRLTMREFGDIIKENNTSFLALGGNAANGAKEFARLSKGFFDSGFGDKLTQLGYTSEDLNNLMAIQLTNLSARELKERGSEQKQFEATAKLAEEMDLMAKLTGISRKEQEKSLQADKANAQIQAALFQDSRKNKGAKESFDAISTQVQGQLGQLVKEMITAGRPLTEETKKYLGTLSQETREAIDDAQAAYASGNKEAAAAAAKRITTADAANAVSDSNLSLARQGVGPFKQRFEEKGRLGMNLEEEARKTGGSLSDPKVADAARKKLEDEIQKEQAARSGETASVIEAQNRIKDMGSAIQESIIVPLTKEANKRALDDFYNTLAKANQSAAKGGTAGSDKGFAGDVSKTVQPAVEGIKSVIARLADEKGPEQKFSSDAAKATNQAQVDALKKAIEGTTRKDFAVTEGNEIKALTKSLKTVDGEVVSKKLEEVAKAQGKSSSDVLKEAINKPGGIGNLTKQLGEDPAAKKQLDISADAVKKEQAAKAATETSKSKGRDTKGTSGEAIAKGAGAIGSALGSLTTGTIELFKVQGDVKIDTAKLPGAAEGGVLKGPESGYLAMLHGEETVIPNKDIDAVISGAISKLPMPKAPGEEKSFAESMAADVRKGMKNVGVGHLNKEPSIDMAAISKDISTTISSVSGGSSTTTKQVQNDESKAAEKELKSVKEQYAAERESLLQKTKEQLGPDAGVRQIRNAMRGSDESKALEEKYKALIGPLEKQIEEGIKWETSTKNAAVEETEKIMSKELLMLKAQGLEKLAITSFNEEEIAKMLEQSGEDLSNFYIDMNGELKSWTDETASAFGQGMSDTELALSEQGKTVDKSVVGGMSFESMFNPVRTSAQSMMEKFGKENEQKKAEEAKTAADKAAAATKPGNAENKTDSKTMPTASSKTSSTLDDVVKSLDRLNMMMGQLLSQSEDLGKKQLRASKANSVQP